MRHIAAGRSARTLAALAAGTLLLSACGGGDDDSASSASPAPAAEQAKELRLGYFANVTHAPALVGVNKGIFAKSLGETKLTTSTFNAGPQAVEALFSGAIDATFIGPSPSINAFEKSGGKAVRVIAGATSGGASLIVKPSINSVADLKGKKLATPQLGNTQDVAARAYLKSQGLATTTQGGGDVSIVPQENAQTLETFRAGQIDAAWVPEPWATRLVQEGGGKELFDEKTLWPGGKWVTTQLLVNTEFLQKNPDVIKRLVQGLTEASEFAKNSPTEAQAAANAEIEKVTGRKISEEVLAASWTKMEFTVDPLAASLKKQAEDAKTVGLLKEVKLDGLYDLQILNDLRKAQNQPAVATG